MAKDFDSNWAQYTHPEVEEVIKEKVAELEERIDESALPEGGIPKSELSSDVQASLDKADSAYQKPASGIPATDIAGGVIPDTSNLATKTEVASKVDKNGTDSLMTAAEHTKLGNLPTATELATQMNAKANVADVYTKTQTDAAIANAVDDLGGGSVESVTVSGTKYTPDTNGDINLGDLRGQDGNSGVASADGVESVNNLNGGTTDTSSKVYVLGANQGKRLRDQMELIYQRVQTLYGLLGNIAFWDGKPAASALLPNLDWAAPKHAVSITNSLSNSVITRNGEPVSSSIQAEEGSTVTLIVAPVGSYALTSVSYAKDGGSSTSATSLGNGTYKIEFVMGGSDVTIAVSGTAQQAYGISYTLTGCEAPSGSINPSSIVSGGTATIQLVAYSGFIMPTSLPSGAVTGASVVSYTPSQDGASATLVIDNANDDVSIVLGAVASYADTTVSVKKITAWPVLDSSFAPTPSDWSMTIVDDNTINCTVSANGKINIPSGYGLFSAVLTMDGVDISECIAFDTLTINVPNATGTLALAVVVAEAVDGMFLGKSFHGSQGTSRTNPGCLVEGGVPTAPSSATANDDWCCMSEFAAIPSTANKLKFVYGNIFASDVNSGSQQPHNKRGVMSLYNNKGVYTVHYAIHQKNTTERVVDMPAESVLVAGAVAYIRASFIKNKLGVSALYYSTDGGTTWVQIFDGSEKNINS